MDSLIYLLIVAADVYALYNIWTSSDDTTKKLIWTAVVVIFPFIGVIVWYFMGPKSSA